MPPEYPKVLLTGLTQQPPVPRWIQRFSPRVASPKQVRALARLPELTVVRAEAPETVLAHQGFLSALAAQLHKTPVPAKIVFVFEGENTATDARQLLKVLTFFDRAADVEFARGSQQAAFALDAAFAKIWADVARPTKESRDTDPLAKVKSVLAATADLRADSGKLSAPRVAEAFGLAVAELAELLGRSRQAVSKTPEGEALQPLLAPFERIARLRTVLSKADFLRWLNMANEQLDGSSPLEVIRKGQVDAAADLAQDMLSGSTT